MFEITTSRLRLIPLEFDYLEMLKNSRSELENALGLEPSDYEFFGKYLDIRIESFMFWSENLQSLKTDYRFHTNWEIIVQGENKSIGSASFLGAPNGKGEVILGYFIDPNYRRKGFMTEAIREISDWALANGAKKVVSFVEEDNPAIEGFLATCGFRKETIYVKD